jgi:hypothetical protein
MLHTVDVQGVAGKFLYLRCLGPQPDSGQQIFSHKYLCLSRNFLGGANLPGWAGLTLGGKVGPTGDRKPAGITAGGRPESQEPPAFLGGLALSPGKLLRRLSLHAVPISEKVRKRPKDALIHSFIGRPVATIKRNWL